MDINPKKFGGHDLDRLRSRAFIGHVIIWLKIYGFLYVALCNQPSKNTALFLKFLRYDELQAEKQNVVLPMPA